ncbi:MAG: Uma2 family endonuclease [Planctomycetes bacterium]|nr:Uma2 family endonuclease [Planctomycetota bacterium]
MAETDWHRELMIALIHTLKAFFAHNPIVYVSGNLLVFYVRGDRLKHLSPDVFVVKGVHDHERPHYLIWEEGKAPQFVIELTSSSTRDEDIDDKFSLYQDMLKVQEYFLFDPLAEYLDPPLRGYRLKKGKYRPIPMIEGRLPSKVLNLHLERDGRRLRLWNPKTEAWLRTPQEEIESLKSEIARLHKKGRREE